MNRVSFILIGIVSCLAVSAHAARHALVIGNDTYAHITPLKNARADAKAMAQGLQDVGFKVTLKLDLSEKQMTRALREFKNTISGGDEAVFYYAGHGVQIGGANYLLPTDLSGEDEDQVRDDAVSLQRVLDDLQDQKARFTLAIVDACRDNPFKSRGRSIGTRGLAPTSAADGQMVIFSAGAGQQALDRVGADDSDPNGLFTRIFVKEMKVPGVPVHDALRNVRDEVVRIARSVNHQQVPAIYDQSIGKFYFNRDALPANPVQIATAAPTAVIEIRIPEAEQVLWNAVSAGNTVQDYEAYLAKYPAGNFAVKARLEIDAIRAAHLADAEKAAWAQAEKLATIEGYRSFLAGHPQGAFGVLAQSRLQRLEAEREKLMAECATCPVVGDVWEYDFVDEFTGPKGKVKYTIQSVGADDLVELIESDRLLDNAVRRQVSRVPSQPGSMVRQKLRSSSDSWWLVEPNFYALLAGKAARVPGKGDRLEMKFAGNNCTGVSSVEEAINLPAGNFNASKINFRCDVELSDFFSAGAFGFRIPMDLIVWVDRASYRPIKIRKILTGWAQHFHADELRLSKVTRMGAAPAALR